MPRRKEHEDDSVRLFGNPFTEVHKWLDEFHDVPGMGGMAHRRKRHHRAGIAEVRAKWGEVASVAALRHVMMDMEQIGYTGPFPENEAECKRLGLWVTR